MSFGGGCSVPTLWFAVPLMVKVPPQPELSARTLGVSIESGGDSPERPNTAGAPVGLQTRTLSLLWRGPLTESAVPNAIVIHALLRPPLTHP